MHTPELNSKGRHSDDWRLKVLFKTNGMYMSWKSHGINDNPVVLSIINCCILEIMSSANIFKDIQEDKIEVSFLCTLVTSSYQCAIVYNTFIELQVSLSALLNCDFFPCLFWTPEIEPLALHILYEHFTSKLYSQSKHEFLIQSIVHFNNCYC